MTRSLSNEHDFSDEIIDLEEFAKANRVPPNRCKGYRIRIDKQSYVVTQPAMKGLQILELASKTPEQYSLYERGAGGQSRPVPPEEVVSFTKPGIEKFLTIPRDPTDG
jgi:hypothetical protein